MQVDFVIKIRDLSFYLQIEKVVDGIVYLLPDAKTYENELVACLERQRF